jgi:hypothetical protein
MTTLEDLLLIEAELKRFQLKLKAAIIAKKEIEARNSYPYTSHKISAAKRSALDLKVELTKLTNG